ncbi:hypothetical protein MVEN_02204200 [Mycena venus]|uniref:DUF6535 domain-containing protein n=1 Tax=Mycena venus TaxID=2733690 RepID=A0A8H6X6M4_9AGAR|nr:hypothetical protein MVEN_02204200 [Mycena venus]
MSPSAAPSEGTGAGDTIHPEGSPAVAEPMNEKPEETIELPVGSNSDNTNRLVGAINEQSATLKTVLESVTKAVEALKQQPQSPDKKIAFWTEYKKLADEFDNELQAKYGQDLDTSLIFAGLFSAVSSAFIIQIQPEFQSDPNGPTQALLSLLVQNMTGLPPAALPPGISLSPPPTIVVVAQSLLYFSLSATLLAALLAVLGKQWLLHYNSVGERGTIEERGLERQRKLDGMRSWRFDLVMQVFPLLLQFALLLFATALAIYLWTIHHAIAAIALSLTGLGSILYTAMIISAVASPDSPFQTSLNSLLKIILDQFYIPKHLHWFFQAIQAHLCPIFDQTCMVISQCTGAFTQMAPLLPLFHSLKPPEPVPSEPLPIFNSPYSQSNEGQAILWALEASTDPRLVEAAAELVPEMQWPVNLNVQPALSRLDDTFKSCIEHRWHVRAGMTDRATACIKAFWILDMVTEEDQRAPHLWAYNFQTIRTGSEELRSIVFWTSKTLDLSYPLPIRSWTLRFIAAQNLPETMLKITLKHFNPSDSDLNKSIFADFLFCLNSFFVPTTAQDCTVLDKSEFSTLLVALLFENLIKRLTDPQPLDHSIANDIVIKVSQIADKVSFTVNQDTDRCVEAGYWFCALSGVSQEAIRSALQLVSSTSVWNLRGILPHSLANIDFTWLSKTLDWVGGLNSSSNARILVDLWQATFLLPSARDALSVESIRVLLSALPTKEDDWDRAHLQAHLACAVLDSTDHWFAEEELCPILQQPSVWANLGHGSWHNWAYYSLGNKLSQHPEWTKIISANLPGWLAAWPGIMEKEEEHQVNFRSVLSRVWNGDEAEANEFGEEATRVMVFNALMSTWNEADFSDWSANHVGHHINLLGCTVTAVFAAWTGLDKASTPSQQFKDTILVHLGEALAKAGERTKHESSNGSDVPPDLRDNIDRLADLLSRLASLIQGNLGTSERAHTVINLDYWRDLENTWQYDVYELHQAINQAKLGGSMVVEKTG